MIAAIALVLGCALLVVPAALLADSSGRTAHAAVRQEQTEKTTLPDTAGAAETELSLTKVEEQMQELASIVYTDEVKAEVNRLSKEDYARYVIQIKNVLMNPDFQALFEYDDVRDLAVTLIHNILEFSIDEPALVREILETMDVSPKAILVFFAVLNAGERRGGVTETIRSFLESDEGKVFMDILAEVVYDKENQKNFKIFLESIEDEVPSILNSINADVEVETE